MRVMVFPGTHNLPLWLMKDVELMYTKSRDEQIAAIQEGRVQVIHTSPDNLLLPDAAGLKAFVAGTVGPLELVSTGREPHVLAVDNPNSGFGRLAYKWLADNLPDFKYDVLAAGGTPQRFQALQQDIAGLAVMHPPFTQLCIDLGYSVLGRIDAGYPTLCGAATQSFIASGGGRHYRESYQQAVTLLSGPQGRTLAKQAMALNLPDMQPERVNSIADVMREEVVNAGVEFDENSFSQLRELRSRQ